MTPFAISLVLSAAVLHALWNALIKASGDRMATMGLICVGHVVLGVALAASAPMPSLYSWLFIAASTVIHFAYYYLLVVSYRLGDLSHVYPIARGMSPILVALGAQVFAGETLPPLAWLGVLVASSGIFLMAGNIVKSATPPIVIGAALATGLMIASYSLVDGMGVRVAGSERGYIGWLFISESLAAVFIFARLGRKTFQLSRKAVVAGLLGGVISAVAYGLVIYAKSFTALGMVSTLRETSVVFAAILGMVWLGERPWKLRLSASSIVAIGVIIMVVAALPT